ncbi:MAG: hypothetical protein ACPH3H_10360 [Pseudomonadales bacterium]
MADSISSAEFCPEVSSFIPRTSIQGRLNKNECVSGFSVKVFLPMPDEGLVSPELTTGTLVPFDPIFLEARGDLEERPPPRGWSVNGAEVFDVFSAL